MNLYRVYLNKMLLPVTPSEITEEIKSKNKTVTLINGEEVNVIKPNGLVEYSFDVTIPWSSRPYVDGNLYDQKYYLDMFEYYKNLTYMRLLIIRQRPNGNDLHTQKNVTLEDYTIKDEAEEGMDIVVSLKFKEYMPYGTQKYTTSKKTRAKKSFAGKKYIIKRNDTLEKIARKKMGTDDVEGNRKKLWKHNKDIIDEACKKTYGTDSYMGEILVEGTTITIPKDSDTLVSTIKSAPVALVNQVRK